LSSLEWPNFINDKINQAYCDLVFLLDRGFPKKSSLNFVGNHYIFDINQRNVLFRAVYPINVVRTVQDHLIRDSALLNNKGLHIDLYNQLFTYYSLINQDPIIISRDGIIRDIFTSLHREKDLKITHDLISQYLSAVSHLKPNRVFFYLDAQKSHSKKHANLISELLPEFDISGECIVNKTVDRFLKEQTQGVTISHDSVILYAAPYCFDFYRWVIGSKILPLVSTEGILDFEKIKCS